METNKMSSKAKTERLKMIRARAAARRAAVVKSVQSEAALEKSEQTSNTTFVDEKTLRSLSTLSGYLGVAAALNAFILIIQIWATLKAGFNLTSVSVVYIFFSVALIGALVWCIKLLGQRRLLVMWVFIGFITVNYFYGLAFRLYSGKAIFAPLDIIVYMVQAAILFEIYRLKRKGILK